MPQFSSVRPASDSDEVDIERVPRHVAATALRPARSLRPGVSMMEAAAAGQLEACAIRDGWRFSYPVRILSRAEQDRFEREIPVVFIG